MDPQVFERPKHSLSHEDKFVARIVRHDFECNLITFKFTTRYCSILELLKLLGTGTAIDPSKVWLASNLGLDVDFLIDVRRAKLPATDFPQYRRLYRIFRTLSGFAASQDTLIHLKKVENMDKKSPNGVYKVLLMREAVGNRMIVMNSSVKTFIALADLLVASNIQCKDLRQVWLFENISSEHFDYVINIESGNDLGGLGKRKSPELENVAAKRTKIGATESPSATLTPTPQKRQETLDKPKKTPPEIIAVCLTCGGIVQNHYKCFHCQRVFLDDPGEPARPEEPAKPVFIRLEIPEVKEI
jgi:hypothetical protein